MVSRTLQARSCSTTCLESHLAHRGADPELGTPQTMQGKRDREWRDSSVPQIPHPLPPGTHTKGCFPLSGLMQWMEWGAVLPSTSISRASEALNCRGQGRGGSGPAGTPGGSRRSPGHTELLAGPAHLPPPSPIPGWRGTSCSSGSWAGTCGQSSRAPWPRWTCGAAGTSPSSRRSSVRRADCPERAVRAGQSHHQEPPPQNSPTQRHSPDVPHPAVPLLLPAPGTALCTFPGELRSLPRCSLPSARCREGGREKQQHHRCGSSRTLKD